jgi:hypothetical protein
MHARGFSTRTMSPWPHEREEKMRKPVPGAVRNGDFSIRPRPGSPAIFYRDVPLWDTVAATLDRYEFFLAERDYAWGDRWELICKDDCGDHYAYGEWTNLAAALSWLRNPEP